MAIPSKIPLLALCSCLWNVLFLIQPIYAADKTVRGGSDGGDGVYYTAFDDASWAICSDELSTILGEDKQALYDDFMSNCEVATDHNGMCATYEEIRLTMNCDQPSSVYNYTKMGYEKIRAPKPLFDLIWKFYQDNKGRDEVEWKHINTFHNMWDTPPTMALLNNESFAGGGLPLQRAIQKEARKVLEAWTGQHLKPVSLYGVRWYHNGSILAPHVDRMPLVTSAIINVDQEVDEPWPLEVYGHDGKAVNVTMEPGDMVLYESHSVLHGRPFPFKGKFFANVFVHFEPQGPLDPNDKTSPQYDEARDLPPYLIPGSKWEKEWIEKNPKGWKGKTISAREAVWGGDFAALKRIGQANKSRLFDPDANGWRPFHEAIRAGHEDMFEYFLKQGADKDQLTFGGVSPLAIALEYLGEDHLITEALRRMEAKNVFAFEEIDDDEEAEEL